MSETTKTIEQLNKKLSEQSEHIQDISKRLTVEIEEQNQVSLRLDSLTQELHDLASQLGVDLPEDLLNNRTCSAPTKSFSVISSAIGMLSPDEQKRLDKELLDSIPSVPNADNLDRFVVVSVGLIALIADFILVGMPQGNRWTPKVEGGVVPTGYVTERLQSWTLDNDNFLAELFKTPYDKATFPGTDIGFSPINHRVLSFGHDPSPMGFLFAMVDIMSGGLTGVSREGNIFHAPGVPPEFSRILYAPLVYLGHLVSDVATKMGLPIPGSSLLMLLNIGMPGAPNGETVSDVTRILYQQGFDFRHYLSGAMVPGIIEGFIRLYHHLRYTKSEDPEWMDLISSSIADKEIASIQKQAHLQALLFWGHAIAAGGNGGRVILEGIATQNFFSAAKNVNLAQWQTFGYRSIQYLHYKMRDTTVEQIRDNRRRINNTWNELLDDSKIPEEIKLLYSTSQ